MMDIGSLFSGIGGIEYGFEQQGFRTIWFIEKDKYAQKVLKKHWPGTPIYGDIVKVDFRTIPKVEILTGGFPCQDISNAGKREGIEGSRSNVWKEYLRAISDIRPKYAFIENVSALTYRGLDTVLCDLASIGYDAEWYCVRASDVGAWHRRERVFIIAYRTEDMAHTHNRGHQPDIRQEKDRRRSTEHTSAEPCSTNTDVPDTDITRVRRRCKEVQSKKKYDAKIEGRNILSVGWWATEPQLGRVAHGVPNRVDRIKCLGNAVVPQVAEVFAKAIREYEARGGGWI